MRAGGGILLVNANDGVAFTLKGGEYDITYIAGNWNSTTVTLEKLAGNGSTWVTAVTAWSANGRIQPKLGPGSYRITIGSGVTGVYVGIDRIPGE